MSKVGNRLAFFLLTAIIIGYVGCEVYTDISTSTDVATDFSKYKSYSWLPDQTDVDDEPYNNQIIRNNLKNYFGQSFSQRGYEHNLDTPGVNLKLIIATKRLEKVVVYPPYPWPYYYGSYYYGGIYYYPYEFGYYYPSHPYYYPPNYYTQKYDYVERAITLNVFDRKQNKLVWSGTLRGDIYDPDYDNKNLKPIADAIMKNYPVKPIIKRKKIIDSVIAGFSY